MALSRFGESIRDWSEAFEAMVEDFEETEEKLFDSEGASEFPSGWAPLNPSYARWKASVRPGAPILVFDGDLRKAATEPRTQLSNKRMTITVEDDTVIKHQFGEGTLVARPPVVFNEPMRDRWMRIIHAFIIPGGDER
jgi:hypothetical protein